MTEVTRKRKASTSVENVLVRTAEDVVKEVNRATEARFDDQRRHVATKVWDLQELAKKSRELREQQTSMTPTASLRGTRAQLYAHTMHRVVIALRTFEPDFRKFVSEHVSQIDARDAVEIEAFLEWAPQYLRELRERVQRHRKECAEALAQDSDRLRSLNADWESLDDEVWSEHLD